MSIYVHQKILINSAKKTRPNQTRHSHFSLAVIWLTVWTWYPQTDFHPHPGSRLVVTGGKQQAVIGYWNRDWIKTPWAWKQREEEEHEHPLKSQIDSFFNLELLFSSLTQTHISIPQHTQDSHRHQWARSADDTHWKQANAQRMDGWLKCSCLPCFPHILITHYSDILSSGEP